MPKIHCKRCRHVSDSIGSHGKHMAKAHRAVLLAQLAKGRKAHRGGHRPKPRPRIADGASGAKIHGFSMSQLYAMLAMIQALIRQSKKPNRAKRSKGKHK